MKTFKKCPRILAIDFFSVGQYHTIGRLTTAGLKPPSATSLDRTVISIRSGWSRCRLYLGTNKFLIQNKIVNANLVAHHARKDLKKNKGPIQYQAKTWSVEKQDKNFLQCITVRRQFLHIKCHKTPLTLYLFRFVIT